MNAKRTACILAVGLFALVAGCDNLARRLITVASTPAVLEGQRTQVTITLRNIHPYPIIPTALTLYVRQDPTEYFLVRQTIGQAEYYEPLQATEVRHLQTLDRIEADQVRDGKHWRRVPDSRFLHPRILLPGKSVSETFQFQAYEPYRRLLYCDLYYLPLTGDQWRDRLFVHTSPRSVDPEAERYTDVYRRIDQDTVTDPEPDPQKYLLFRPRRHHAATPTLLTRRVPIDVRPRPFSYRAAARRAAMGARTHLYFSAGECWVFEYPQDGTWLIGPVATVKLNGHYASLLADVELRQAQSLAISAPREQNDKLLQYFQKAAFSDPKDTAANATATIPAESILPALEHAEATGYVIESRTWKPVQ